MQKPSFILTVLPSDEHFSQRHMDPKLKKQSAWGIPDHYQQTDFVQPVLMGKGKSHLPPPTPPPLQAHSLSSTNNSLGDAMLLPVA